MIFDQHVAQNSTSTIRPELAERWAWSGDNKTLTFKLRKDVRFHSGNPLGAGDVAYSLNRIKAIKKAVARRYKIKVADLEGPSRREIYSKPRQIAMYLVRELTSMSLNDIGLVFGGKDHTTVMHADRKIRKLMAEKHAVYNQVTELTARIKQQARQS